MADLDRCIPLFLRLAYAFIGVDGSEYDEECDDDECDKEDDENEADLLADFFQGKMELKKLGLECFCMVFILGLLNW